MALNPLFNLLDSAGQISVLSIATDHDAAASVLKLWAGNYSDRKHGQRKKLMLFGYGLSNLARPLLGLATGWGTVLYLAKELQNYVEGIPDAQMKAIGYHFVAGIYNYLRLRYDNDIVFGPLAFKSMKNAFDTNNRDVKIVLSYAEMIDDFASRNFFQRVLIALRLEISFKREGKRAYESMEYIVKHSSREEINAFMENVERGDRFMAMYKKMKRYR